MKRIGSTVEVTNKKSQFSGQKGKVVKRLHPGAVAVRIEGYVSATDGSDGLLLFEETDLATVANAPGVMLHVGGKAGR